VPAAKTLMHAQRGGAARKSFRICQVSLMKERDHVTRPPIFLDQGFEHRPPSLLWMAGLPTLPRLFGYTRARGGSESSEMFQVMEGGVLRGDMIYRRDCRGSSWAVRWSRSGSERMMRLVSIKIFCVGTGRSRMALMARVAARSSNATELDNPPRGSFACQR